MKYKNKCPTDNFLQIIKSYYLKFLNIKSYLQNESYLKYPRLDHMKNVKIVPKRKLYKLHHDIYLINRKINILKTSRTTWVFNIIWTINIIGIRSSADREILAIYQWCAFKNISSVTFNIMYARLSAYNCFTVQATKLVSKDSNQVKSFNFSGNLLVKFDVIKRSFS